MKRLLIIFIFISYSTFTYSQAPNWQIDQNYDAFQALKMKKEKLKGKCIKIQAAGWKEGVYIVRVKYKDEVLTEQLVVKP